MRATVIVLIMRFLGLLTACTLVIGLSACSGPDVDPQTDLRDPCPLISDDMLARLAPGATRERDVRLERHSAKLGCDVDLTAGDGFRGDLYVGVEAEARYPRDEAEQARLCSEIGVPPAADGPGDRSCFSVRRWDGSQARIDGWAFVGENYAAQVAYQLVDPREFPAGAEEDLRSLLENAVSTLP